MGTGCESLHYSSPPASKISKDLLRRPRIVASRTPFHLPRRRRPDCPCSGTPITTRSSNSASKELAEEQKKGRKRIREKNKSRVRLPIKSIASCRDKEESLEFLHEKKENGGLMARHKGKKVRVLKGRLFLFFCLVLVFLSINLNLTIIM